MSANFSLILIRCRRILFSTASATPYEDVEVYDAAFTYVSFELDNTNNPPVVSNIPNQTIAFGEDFTAINLDSYVSDPDNFDADISWAASGDIELTVTITNRVATISTPQGWGGSETITFTATDPGGLEDSDAVTFKIDTDNDGTQDDVDTDDDDDGMPDDWELTHGLSPIIDDANEDPDQDGFTNIIEYNKGTDPQDPGSHPSRGMPWLPLLLEDD